MSTRRNQAPKVKVMETLPNLADTQVGELYYDSTNGKFAIRLISGWVYWTQDA